MRKTVQLLCICLCAVTMVAICATGPAEEVIGVYGTWGVYQNKIAGHKVCYMAETPQKSSGKYSKRGDCFLMISSYPAQQIRGEVSFIAGYTYNSKTPPSLTIDKNKTVALSPEKDGEAAWTADEMTDKNVIEQMKKGNLLRVQGVSARGTKITDLFSLKGFSKAYETLEKCAGIK